MANPRPLASLASRHAERRRGLHTGMWRLADRLATEPGGAPERYFWPGLLPSTLLFLMVVLAHRIRRLAPPC